MKRDYSFSKLENPEILQNYSAVGAEKCLNYIRKLWVQMDAVFFDIRLTTGCLPPPKGMGAYYIRCVGVGSGVTLLCAIFF